jgi:hypothetical protein
VSVLLVPTSTTFTVGWNATDAVSGAVSYDVRYRAAYASGSFGSYFGWKLRTYDLKAPLTGIPGTTYCFSARAWDAAGNVSNWGAEKCSLVPLDDRALTATGTWTRTEGTDYYLATVSRSVTAGAKLTSPTVSARRFILLVTKCPTCGTIDVYWNGALLGTANLTASTTVKRQAVSLPQISQAQTGVLTVIVRSSGQPVEIDGLVASRV